jgi:hypothetical protein
MGLQQFERRLERLVEGAFARAFRSGLQPVEVGRRLTREMDLRRTVAPKGTLTPNAFTVALSPEDHDRFAPIEEELVAELIEQARDHARAEGYVFIGPLSVTIDVDPALASGMLVVAGEMERPDPGRAGAPLVAREMDRPDPGRGGAPLVAREMDRPDPGRAGAALIAPDGRRIPLAYAPVILGRLPECDVVLADPNVSRRHAEVAPDGLGGWVVRDLGSTNGTRRNGVPVRAPVRLEPGDEIVVGASAVRFEG